MGCNHPKNKWDEGGLDTDGNNPGFYKWIFDRGTETWGESVMLLYNQPHNLDSEYRN